MAAKTFSEGRKPFNYVDFEHMPVSIIWGVGHPNKKPRKKPQETYGLWLLLSLSHPAGFAESTILTFRVSDPV